MRLKANSRLPMRLLLIILLLCCGNLAGGAEFNYEVERRVLEHLTNYMNKPVLMTTTMSNLDFVGGIFENDLREPDRDTFLKIAASLPVYHIYYSLEDGTTVVHCSFDGKYGVYYRESGFSGYPIDDPSMQKHYKSCFDIDNGNIENCTMSAGDPYSRCVDDCELELCPDADSQRDCSELKNEEAQIQCERNKKYCKKYETVYVPEGQGKVGHIPMVGMCHDVRGLPTEEIGKVQRSYMPDKHDFAATLSLFDGTYIDSTRKLENCYYKDGNTLVQSQHVEDEYAYCGGNGEKCNPFIGAFNHFTFDPRTQAYHLGAKQRGKAYWTEPYAFFNNELGIGFIHPIFKLEEGKRVFHGVIGSDYLLSDITDYLQQVATQGSNTGIAIFDESDFLIGVSTGTLGLKKVLSDDGTERCPDGDENADCTFVRVPMTDLSSWTKRSMDEIIFKAWEQHNQAGYPKELISFKENDDDLDANVFVSQVSLFESRNLKWRILVVSAAERSTADSIQLGDPFFAAVFAIALVGFLLCMTSVGIFYRKRAEKAVECSDWRFTCAFIVGCACFNGSSFAVLGPNTDATCMLRMWLFHFFLVAALAPLVIKVWRIKKLVGNPTIKRVSISNRKATIYCAPIILIQVLILTLVSILDPPMQAEIVEDDNKNLIVQRIVCQQDTDALFYASLFYEGSLVLFGCLLAYQSRNLDDAYGESPQLIFAMYNILLVGVTFLALLGVADIDRRGQKLLLVIGVFWGSVISSAAFVIPRLIQVRRASLERQTLGTTRISGLSPHPSGSIHFGSAESDVSIPLAATSSSAAFERSNQGTISTAGLTPSSGDESTASAK